MEIFDDNIEFIEAKVTPETAERLRRVRGILDEPGNISDCVYVPGSHVDTFPRLTGPGLDGVRVEVRE